MCARLCAFVPDIGGPDRSIALLYLPTITQKRQLTIADLAVYPVLHWITTSITTPESLGAYPPLSQLMARIEAHPRVADFYRREREREERKAAAVAAGAEGAGAGASDGGDGH